MAALSRLFFKKNTVIKKPLTSLTGYVIVLNRFKENADAAFS